MTTFVDTSALYALLDEDDEHHAAAATWLREAVAAPGEILSTHSYVVVETTALVHRRLGTVAVTALLDGLLPAVNVVHVDAELYRSGVGSYRAGLARGASLVDHVSFEFMRWRGLARAFAFDEDFARAGFEVTPG